MLPLRNADITSTLLPDGYIVLTNAKTDWAHTLNPAGALVWEFCDGQHSLEEIVSEVVLLTGTDDRVAANRGVEDLIADLAKKGLLVETTGGES